MPALIVAGFAKKRAGGIAGSAEGAGRPQGVAEQLRSAGGKSAKKVRKWARWGALALLTALVLWLVAEQWQQAGRGWKLFRDSVTGLRWTWVVASGVLALVTYLVRALRWAGMMRAIKAAPNLCNLVLATAIGFTAVVLFGRPAEVVRPYLIATREQVPLASQFGLWAVERVCDLVALLVVLGIALTRAASGDFALSPAARTSAGAAGLVLVAATAGGLALLAGASRFPKAFESRLQEALRGLSPRYWEAIERGLTNFLAGLRCIRAPGTSLRLVFYTVLEWTVIAAGYCCLFKASHWTEKLGLSEAVLFMGLASLGTLVQLPGVGGGVQVASAVVLTEVFGLPLGAAAGLAVVYWAATFLVVVPAGLLAGLVAGIDWLRLKRLRVEVRT